MIDKPQSSTAIGPDPFEAANEPEPTGLGEPGPASYLGAPSGETRSRPQRGDWQRGGGGYEEQAEALREQFDVLDQRVRTFARERPFAAVGSALLAGYLLGRLMSRF